MKDSVVINISVSGGRTSAYMAWWMSQNRQAVAEYLGCEESAMRYYFTFANTGMEHDDTLRFMNDVDNKLLGGQVVWVEGVAQHGKRLGTKHRVVTYETAYRNNQWKDPKHPFHDNILKYGISNTTFMPCTRELKKNAMDSYRTHSLGLKSSKEYYTAIGIRADEDRRVSKNAGVQNIIYPLVHINPVDKEDVLDAFSAFDWDLKIPEWQGNCITCYKKSFKKLNKVWHETPEAFEFNDWMETHYQFIGPEFKKHGVTRPRTFFRGNRSTKDMIAMFRENPADPSDFIDVMNDAGCSESCEMYETETIDMFEQQRAL